MKSLAFKTPLTDSGNEVLKNKLSARISNNLKRARNNKGMTQQEVAEKAGLHLTYLGHLEAGKYHPSTFVLWKIAKVLGVGLDNLTA
jgi:transcriptional regulator with XRE-family HTH domain